MNEEKIQIKKIAIDEKNIEFYNMRKSHLLNDVTKIAEKGRNTNTDLNGKSIITHKDIVIKIDHQSTKGAITAATWQFLDYLLIVQNKSGQNERQIIISVDDFMTVRGLKNTKYATRIIREHINQLSEMWVSWNETVKSGNKTIYKAFSDIRILSQKGGKIRTDGGGYYTVTITPEMHEYFQTFAKKIFDYPSFLQRINTNDNAAAYYIGRKIAEHKNIATVKEQKNENFLSIKSLLASCLAIPTYDEVKKTDRLYIRRIIEPFIKGLDGLSPYIKWNFAKAKHEKLTDEECENIEKDINLFLTAYIEFEWIAYPDKTKAIEKRRKAITKAESRREKAKLKAAIAIEKKKLEANETQAQEITSNL